MNLSEKQISIFNILKEDICESVEAIPVNKNAIKITTPFIDWKGSLVSIYVTEDGKVTDGGDTINQLRSLRVIDDFEEWPFQLDYFNRYNIQIIRNSLEPIDIESKSVLLDYVQGIARIPSFFEPKPIHSSADNYPIIARTIAKEGLIETFNMSPEDVLKYTNPNTINLKSGRSIQNEMSPLNENKIIKIISHSSSTSTDKRQHVDHKVLSSVLWKRENSKVQLYAIL